MSRKILTISKDFSDRLRDVMKFLGFAERKQAEFAKNIGVSAAYLSDVLNLKSGPSFGLILGISNVFPVVDSNWLLTGNGKLQKDEIKLKIKLIYKDEDPEITRLLGMTHKILKSGTDYSFSLAANIKSFHKSVELETEVHDLKGKVHALNGKVSKIEGKLSSATEQIRKDDAPEGKNEIIKRRVM